MTALQVPQQAPEDGLLYKLRHPGQAWRAWREEAKEARQALIRPEHKLLTGEDVRFRFGQMTIWGIAAGFVGACAIAGVYFALFETYWHMPFGLFGVHGGGSLKGWWDNLFSGPVWPAFRHAAFRDIPEPVFALMAVQTLLARDKYEPVSTRRIIVSPVVIVFATFALGALSVWLVDFAFPDLWHWAVTAQGHPSWRLDHTAWLGRWSLGVLIPGLIINRILRLYWAPVGATLQGYLLDRTIDRKQGIVRDCGVEPMTAVEFDRKGWHIIPWIIRLPLTPPVMRERFAKLWRSNAKISVHNAHGRVTGFIIAVVFVLVVIGFIGHYLIGSAGIHVPYFSAGA
jgi:hypothetical protein